MKQKNYFSIVRATLLALLVLLFVPSSVKGATYNFDWRYWLNAATNAYIHDSGSDTECSGSIIMSGNNYANIEGAQTVTRVQYRSYNAQTNKYSTSKMEIEERLAFVLNTNGKANEYNDGNGWYLRAEPNSNGNGYAHRALYTGSWNNKLAILSLRAGDKVTINFEGGDHVSQYGAAIHYIQSVHCYQNGGQDAYYNNTYFASGEAINITSSGDLIVEANIGTYITDIKIETVDVADYTIRTNNDGSSEFWFTKAGVLEDNDFAVPYMSFSFGNINDYLLVQGTNQNNYNVSMINSSGNEVLETNGTNYQPSAGSFYAFKPTANGTIYVSGEMTGRVHLFVYDPTVGQVGDWVEKLPKVFYRETFSDNSFDFNVETGKIYYLCINNQSQEERDGNYAFHLHWMKFVNSFKVGKLAKVIDLTNVEDNSWIELTTIEGYNSYNIHTKRCSGNINPPASTDYQIQYGHLYMKKPTFAEGTDNAGTVLIDVKTNAGDVVFAATFPYHADFNPVGYTDTNRTYGHTWNFIDPRNSDSNIGNCWINDGWDSFSKGTTTGILSIGQYKDTNSQFYYETQNREWTYAQRITGTDGGFHDPMYKNIFDMEGDNADMIWETEGLIFNTGSNISCLWNENDAVDQSKTNPLDFATLGDTDPDRYVGLLPVTDDKKSEFTIPGLKNGDRVLIFMKSGEATGEDGIFLHITGAKDALGKKIETDETDTWYKAGGTNWQHNRYEGCYHFIKDGDGDMTFDMQSGSMCKLLYIRIYTGQRIPTNSITSQNSQENDPGRLLFMNDKGATTGSSSTLTLHFRDKGQQQKADILTCSGNLNYKLKVKKNHNEDEKDDHFTVGGTYYQSIGFTSKVGEIGMFRLRLRDVEYNENYTADFSDRNFTVGYRDKVDSYPYTWDFTDIQGFSSTAMSTEANKYPIDDAANDLYGNEWDISLFDTNGYMKLNSGYDPSDHNIIFSPHKIGYGNQLWAGGGAIPETRGLWFYSEDDDDTEFDKTYYTSLYNDCLQITSEGIRFANIPDTQGKRVAWWNYKMVVPDVPANAAVYLRMKRDLSVSDDAKTWSVIDNDYVPFVATRFHFGNNPKTQLFTDSPVENGSNYSFYQVPGTTDEYILAIKNTTGATNHLTYTLNGWIVKKLAVSTDGKKVNDLGYTTESRNHAIDHSLTSFFSGGAFTTYIVTGADEETLSVTAEPVTTSTPVLPANTGCFIQNTNQVAENDYQYKVFDHSTDQFHLFAPDMHDTEKLMGVTYNMMRPMPAEGVGRTSTENGKTYYNYVMTSNWVSVNPETGEVNPNGPTSEGKAKVEGFYRIVAGQTATGTNKAYLPIEQSTVNNAPAAYFLNLVPTAVDPEEPLSEDYGNQDVDAISLQNAADVDAVWYNMNGQKLNGKPAKSGIYIMNGRKVVIK